ncbi:MAG: Crp/Fnr family transcriptional regulator [bacterium]|nr:Crp/Fnr family transcriptional regulator [bacterium]
MRKFQAPSCESCKARLDSVFCKLTEQELTDLSIQKHCNFFVKGETIFNEGNFPSGLYCINNGRVKIYQNGSDGKEQILRLAKEGDILGYRALISGETYSASASVIEDSKVCLIPKEVFYHLLTSNSDITTKVMKLLATELRDAENKITDLAQKPVIERLAETLLMLKEYYGYNKEDTSLNITVSREEIANIVGTATETAIRLLSDMKKQGIIDLDGKKIKILKSDALIKLANLYD